MVHFKFTRKNVRRLCVTMALIAPIIYLFGALFTGLNGAHGQQIFADGEETSQKSYEELMEVNNFSYGAFDWSNDYGSRIGFSLGHLRLDNVTLSDFNYYLTFSMYGVGFQNYVDSDPSSLYDFGLGFSGEGLDLYISFDCYVDSINPDEVVNSFDVPWDFYCCFYYVSSRNDVIAFVSNTNHFDPVLYWFVFNNGSWVSTSPFDYSNNDIQWFVYFDDGAHLPAGVSWNDELASYFVPKVKVTEKQTYSDYVFGQFFARDNFVSKIGEDAISETPHGFAPFGSLFRYIDQNALHMADTQVGLMAYGYMYWCAHVLLFDVLFMMTTFFISFIERVGDRLGGNE